MRRGKESLIGFLFGDIGIVCCAVGLPVFYCNFLGVEKGLRAFVFFSRYPWY